MPENSRGLIFRKRNVLGVALAAGIGLGIYLGKMGLDFGFGQKGRDGGNGAVASKSGDAPERADAPAPSSGQDDALPAVVPNVVQVIIDERQYLLLQGDKTTPIELADLIGRIKKAPGDADHIKARVYRRLTARAGAEEALRNGLLAADVLETAVYWVPPANQGR